MPQNYPKFVESRAALICHYPLPLQAIAKNFAAHAGFVKRAEYEIFLHPGSGSVATVKLRVVGGKIRHVLPVPPNQAEDVVVRRARVGGVPRHDASLRVSPNVVKNQLLAITDF